MQPYRTDLFGRVPSHVFRPRRRPSHGRFSPLAPEDRAEAFLSPSGRESGAPRALPSQPTGPPQATSTLSLTSMRSYVHMFTCPRPHTQYARTRNSRAHAQAHARTHARTHARAHTQTHTHTQTSTPRGPLSVRRGLSARAAHPSGYPRLRRPVRTARRRRRRRRRLRLLRRRRRLRLDGRGAGRIGLGHLPRPERRRWSRSRGQSQPQRVQMTRTACAADDAPASEHNPAASSATEGNIRRKRARLVSPRAIEDRQRDVERTVVPIKSAMLSCPI